MTKIQLRKKKSILLRTHFTFVKVRDSEYPESKGPRGRERGAS